jgi:hypothetical protein
MTNSTDYIQRKAVYILIKKQRTEDSILSRSSLKDNMCEIHRFI